MVLPSLLPPPPPLTPGCTLVKLLLTTFYFWLPPTPWSWWKPQKNIFFLKFFFWELPLSGFLFMDSFKSLLMKPHNCFFFAAKPLQFFSSSPSQLWKFQSTRLLIVKMTRVQPGGLSPPLTGGLWLATLAHRGGGGGLRPPGCTRVIFTINNLVLINFHNWEGEDSKDMCIILPTSLNCSCNSTYPALQKFGVGVHKSWILVTGWLWSEVKITCGGINWVRWQHQDTLVAPDTLVTPGHFINTLVTPGHFNTRML